MDNFITPIKKPTFDWYQATVFAEPKDVLDAFQEMTPGASWRHEDRAPQGYGFAWSLNDADGHLGRFMCGGKQPNPHIIFSGEGTPIGAELLRSLFPDHAVTRVDVIAVDTLTPGAYDVMQAAALDVAKRKRIKVGTAGDHLLTMEGRTLYLGSPSSRVRCRLYDKAAELRHKLSNNPLKLAQVPDEMARLELQIRPQGASKVAVASWSASPELLLGSGMWFADLLRLLRLLDVEPYSVRPVWRQADLERAKWAMLNQYGNVFRELLEECGSPDLVGRNLFADLAQLAALKRGGDRGGSPK